MFWIIFGIVSTIVTSWVGIRAVRKDFKQTVSFLETGDPEHDKELERLSKQISKEDEVGPDEILGKLFYGAFIIICLLLFNMGSISLWSNTVEMREFENYQAMAESTVSEREEVNYTMNNKILEYNEWLSDGKTSREIYGLFSMYPKRISEIDYIRIEGDMDE